MTPNEYQDAAMKFAKYEHADYPFLALSEEAGEVAGKLAKYVRKNDVTLTEALSQARFPYQYHHEVLEKDLCLELGDLLWQLSACCREIGMTLEDVMEANLTKLKDRNERNVIIGEGDAR